ncbi:hypothetical protein J6590_004027 [Homalodisca vitripennis]|nr:hypothetical protein J6590_004027 [Homalodisca vitripennis]
MIALERLEHRNLKWQLLGFSARIIAINHFMDSAVVLFIRPQVTNKCQVFQEQYCVWSRGRARQGPVRRALSRCRGEQSNFLSREDPPRLRSR